MTFQFDIKCTLYYNVNLLLNTNLHIELAEAAS